VVKVPLYFGAMMWGRHRQGSPKRAFHFSHRCRCRCRSPMRNRQEVRRRQKRCRRNCSTTKLQTPSQCRKAKAGEETFCLRSAA